MHNGVFNTLEEVIAFYNRGGSKRLNMDLEFQTLPSTRLHINQQEVSDLIAFMKTLTDTL